MGTSLARVSDLSNCRHNQKIAFLLENAKRTLKAQLAPMFDITDLRMVMDIELVSLVQGYLDIEQHFAVN